MSDAKAPEAPKVPAKAAAKAVEPVPMTKADILAYVDKIIDKQDGVKTWGHREHLMLLSKIFEEHASGVDPKGENMRTVRLDFKATMAFNGIGGNASQFRQWLASEDGGKRVPESKRQKVNALLDELE